VVGGREQIHGGVVGQQVDVVVRVQRLDQLFLDRASRGVVGVQDATDRVRGLAREFQVAVGVERKRHFVLFDQQLPHQPRTVLCQDAYRASVVHIIAGTNQVGCQFVGRILVALVDDAALGVPRVRVVRVLGLGHDNDAQRRVARQLQRRGCAGNATADNQDVAREQFGHFQHL